MSDFMDIKEFHESGLLQEVNRRFLNPLGLALGLYGDKDFGVASGQFAYCSVERTDDPDGMCFEELTESDVRRGEALEARFQAAIAHREAAVGYGIQPLEVSK